MADSDHKGGISRRGFVAGMVAILGGIMTVVVGIPAIGYILSPAVRGSKSSTDEWVPLAPVEDIPDDEPTLYTFTRTKQVGWERSATSYGVYVTKKLENDYDCFSNVCTHLNCRVTWFDDENAYLCPCHDGEFAKDGSVVSGPPPRPLDEFDYKVEEGTLMIHIQET
ncbi:MAG: Rieske 2Fe-2S domain-containing protein [Anaerolineales bacterium]|nr:Rieske 2Fe-2S domain-containing protein [Anaerolineales bacterium]